MPSRCPRHAFAIAPGALVADTTELAVRYIPPFEALKGLMTVSNAGGELTVSASYEDFVDLVRTVIACVEVDEAWYLQRYPDIAEAIAAGSVKSAAQHFKENGYLEGRQPFPIQINERWYLEHNPGVSEHVRKGLLKSGQQHFDEHGYSEGRLPFPP
jgi:hypothetical protein